MNILYCGDGNTADGLTISVLSLLKTVTEPLHIYILTATVESGSTLYKALSPDEARRLSHLVKTKSPENTVELRDITPLFAAEPPLANLQTRFTPCCMLRLYADLVPGLPDRLLYLDNDVVCRENPAAFYAQDMTDFELCGVLDYYGSWFFKHHPFRRDYLNSGVLLLNLPKIRETALFARCRARCATVEMFMPDQSAINKLSAHKKICPRRYNEQRCLKKNTVFQHFTTSFRLFPWFHTVSVKPWNIEGMHRTLKLHEYDDILEQYARLREAPLKEAF